MEGHQPIGGVTVGLNDPRRTDRPTTTGLDDPRALQILSTEHWSLLASRSLAYNEAFSRAGMFLSFLSATLIVMGFLLSSDSFRPIVVPVVALLLLADLYLGLATIGRLIDANAEELTAVRGMNRIRHAYRDMAPDLEPYFVSGFHDDAAGVIVTYGGRRPSRGVVPTVIHGLTTAVGMVATITAFLFGSLVSVFGIAAGLGSGAVIVVGVAGFAIAFAGFIARSQSQIRSTLKSDALFPSPEE